MDSDFESETAGPIVVLARVGDAYTAFIDPPLATGDHRTIATTKDAVWQAARDLWQTFRLGLRDDSGPVTCRSPSREKFSRNKKPCRF